MGGTTTCGGVLTGTLGGTVVGGVERATVVGGVERGTVVDGAGTVITMSTSLGSGLVAGTGTSTEAGGAGGAGGTVTGPAGGAVVGGVAGRGRATGVSGGWVDGTGGTMPRALSRPNPCGPGIGPPPSATAINASATTSAHTLTMNDPNRRRRRFGSPSNTGVLPLPPRSFLHLIPRESRPADAKP